MLLLLIGNITTLSFGKDNDSRSVTRSGLVGIQIVSQTNPNSIICFSIKVVYTSSQGSRNFGIPLILLANPAAGNIPSI
jgi:hypothetical protein